MLEEPPRPVCPTGGEAKRRRARPSVRPSPFFNTSVRHACLSQFNKCYVGNASHRRIHCVILSPVHPQSCKGYQTHNSPYSSTHKDECATASLQHQQASRRPQTPPPVLQPGELLQARVIFVSLYTHGHYVQTLSKYSTRPLRPSRL